MSAALGGRWHSWRIREDIVSLALAARHCYQRNRHYLVRDGKVEIIDEATGRAAPRRVWSRGLHNLVEIKEGCKPTPATRTIAQITYQRFFPRYLRLGGMSGTLSEARGELREIYGLSVQPVALRTPCIRKVLPTRLFVDQAALWTAVAGRIAAIQDSGRPVLVGTGSVAESEALSSRLRQAGIEHRVLNACLDREEALIVAQAGQPGQITVTTNMAGRGTDIALAPGVAAAGGLHVLCCQHNASRRIDRQLQGRSARQGDPGSTETWLALNEESGPSLIRLGNFKRHQQNQEILLPQPLLRTWLAWQQDRRAARERRARRLMLQADRAWEQGLSFRGKGE
jgi:preprotein translocase subunit SecA